MASRVTLCLRLKGASSASACISERDGGICAGIAVVDSRKKSSEAIEASMLYNPMEFASDVIFHWIRRPCLFKKFDIRGGDDLIIGWSRKRHGSTDPPQRLHNWRLFVSFPKSVGDNLCDREQEKPGIKTSQSRDQ